MKCAGHQVGRLQPLEDAAAVLHIREAVGKAVELRADANQKWCLSEALQFGHAVKGAGLQVGLCIDNSSAATLLPNAHEQAPFLTVISTACSCLFLYWQCLPVGTGMLVIPFLP